MRPLKSLKLLGHHLRDSLLSIRVRLTLWYVVFLGLVLVVFGAFLYANLARSLPRQIAHDVKVEANQLASTLNLENGTPTLAGTLNELPPGMVVVLYNAAGQQLDTSDAHQPLPALPAALQAARTGVGSTNTARTPGGNEWEVVTIPIRNNQHIAGILQVAQSDAQAHGALDQLVVFMAISIPLVLLMAVVGGLFLASRALGPIDRVTRAAQRIGAEDLSQRLHFPRNADEIGRLASTFDDMLDRLQRAFQLQRQFTADASHELRTPLAMLVSRTELALERARRAPEYRLALEETHRDAVRMSQLLAELLTLARADSGREEILRERVDLSELAVDVIQAMLPLAQARQVHLAAGPAEPRVVVGDATRLTQLLLNLVGNAISYTSAGGHVRVDVKQMDGWELLSVTDSGIGIAPEHLPHLFERFYRVDKARARSEGGTGLGLSIADWIVRAHGGHIEVTSSVGVGTTFTAWLPSLAPAHQAA